KRLPRHNLPSEMNRNGACHLTRSYSAPASKTVSSPAHATVWHRRYPPSLDAEQRHGPLRMDGSPSSAPASLGSGGRAGGRGDRGGRYFVGPPRLGSSGRPTR